MVWAFLFFGKLICNVKQSVLWLLLKMKCRKCQIDNPDDNKFCRECGTKLILTCSNCGDELRAGDKFCGKCGHDLRDPTESIPIDYSEPQSYTPKFLVDKILTSRSSIEGERKLVTVLFADVANYTAMSAELDPEEVHQIMDGCFKILMEEIHKYEGTINQFTGDGVMALFGAPLAHEDHAQRACYAALAIQEAMEQYGTNLAKAYGVKFLMRIGLNSGTVIVGAIGDDLRMDYTAVGDTTNLAARVESIAQPGTVLGTSEIYKLTKDFFQFESKGKVQIKGKEEAVETFQLLKAAEIVTRIEAATVKGLTKFVGRDDETLSLEKAFEKARSESGQVVGVVGEAGVGKSRLLIELIKMLPKGDYTFLEGKCLHYGHSIPYLPILDILRGYFGIKERDLETFIKRKIEEKITYLDEDLKAALIPLHHLFSLKIAGEAYHKLESKQKIKKIFEPIRNLFVCESKNKPLVIAVEDLHWIDKSSEEFLDYLTGALGNARILLILLYRPEYSCQWESNSSYTKIGLNQLQRESSTEMVNAILSDSKVVPELIEFITSKAGGNPLFVEELIKSLLESGLIQRKDYQYIASRKVSQFKVPDTIQGIIASRIDRLEESTKQILQVASVIGREFTFRILQTTIGIEADFKPHLRELERLEFISKNRLSPMLEYTFKHALIHEVAYSSLLHKKRKEIHEKTGEAVESLYSESIEKYYEFLAYQYGSSANTDKAIEYLSLANEKVAKASAMKEARVYFDKAMNLLEAQAETKDNHRRRISLLLKQYYVFMRMWKLPEYYDLLTRYHPMAIELNDETLLGAFYALLGRCEYNNGYLDQAIVTVRKAIEFCEASGNFESAIFSYLTLQLSHMYRGDFEEVIKLKDEIFRVMKERLNDRWYALESCSASWAFSHLGRWDEAIEEGQRALSLVQGITDRSLISFANWVLSFAYTCKGIPDQAIKYGQTGVKRAPTPSDKTWAQGILSWAWCRAGNPKKGVDELATGTRVSRAVNFMPSEIMQTIMLGEGYWLLREFDKANDILKQGVDLAERCGMKFYLGWAHRLLGEIAMETNLAKAAAYFEKGIDFLKETKAENELALAYAGYGKLHKQDGNIPKARKYLTEALEILGRLGTLSEPDKVKKELEQLTED